jgi:hypothetical protein
VKKRGRKITSTGDPKARERTARSRANKRKAILTPEILAKIDASISKDAPFREEAVAAIHRAYLAQRAWPAKNECAIRYPFKSLREWAYLRRDN